MHMTYVSHCAVVVCVQLQPICFNFQRRYNLIKVKLYQLGHAFATCTTSSNTLSTYTNLLQYHTRDKCPTIVRTYNRWVIPSQQSLVLQANKQGLYLRIVNPPKICTTLSHPLCIAPSNNAQHPLPSDASKHHIVLPIDPKQHLVNCTCTFRHPLTNSPQTLPPNFCRIRNMRS